MNVFARISLKFVWNFHIFRNLGWFWVYFRFSTFQNHSENICRRVEREKKNKRNIAKSSKFCWNKPTEMNFTIEIYCQFDLVDFIWMEINRQNWKYWEKYSDKFRNYHIQRDTTIDTIFILIFHLCETNVNVMTSDDTQSEQNYTQNTWMETRTMKTNDKHERKRSTHKIGRHYCSDREWIQFI